jgi:hypothetical protein
MAMVTESFTFKPMFFTEPSVMATTEFECADLHCYLGHRLSFRDAVTVP